MSVKCKNSTNVVHFGDDYNFDIIIEVIPLSVSRKPIFLLKKEKKKREGSDFRIQDSFARFLCSVVFAFRLESFVLNSVH